MPLIDVFIAAMITLGPASKGLQTNAEMCRSSTEINADDIVLVAK